MATKTEKIEAILLAINAHLENGKEVPTLLLRAYAELMASDEE